MVTFQRDTSEVRIIPKKKTLSLKDIPIPSPYELYGIRKKKKRKK